MATLNLTLTPPSGRYPRGTELKFSSNIEAEFFYTMDGSDPNLGSRKYFTPISLETEAQIRVLAVSAYGDMATSEETYNISTNNNALDRVLTLDSRLGPIKPLPTKSGSYGERTRVKSFVDPETRLITSYYYDNLHYQWVKVVSEIPEGEKVFIGDTIFTNPHAWRNYKSAGSRYSFEPSKIVTIEKRFKDSLSHDFNRTRSINDPY